MEATLERSLVSESTHKLVDRLEHDLVNSDCIEMIDPPVIHGFADGMYIRTIFMPKGSKVTSKIHKKKHPYVITAGELDVWSEDKGVQHIKAPFHGITEAGTRRVLQCHTDTVWTTYHATSLTDVAEIEKEIIEPHDNPLLEEEMKSLLKGGEL